MPLTNAQKQAAHRARVAAKIARYEAALKSILAIPDDSPAAAYRIRALNALNNGDAA